MEKKFQDESKETFYQPYKPQLYYHHPLPTYSSKPNEFEKLVYVASSFFNSKPKNCFNHTTDVSQFRSVISKK